MEHDLRRWMRLVEGRDAPLYHFTLLPALMAIINTDCLGKGEGVSLTRDINSPYFSHGFWTKVALVIDQSRLGSRYRIEPRSGAAYADDFTLFQKGGEKHKAKEQEEFVSQPIMPLHPYLTHIVLSDSKFMTDLLRHMRRQMSGKPQAKSFERFRDLVNRQLYRAVPYSEGQYRDADAVLNPDNWRMLFEYCGRYGIVLTQQPMRATFDFDGTRRLNLWHRQLDNTRQSSK